MGGRQPPRRDGADEVPVAEVPGDFFQQLALARLAEHGAAEPVGLRNEGHADPHRQVEHRDPLLHDGLLGVRVQVIDDAGRLAGLRRGAAACAEQRDAEQQVKGGAAPGR